VGYWRTIRRRQTLIAKKAQGKKNPRSRVLKKKGSKTKKISKREDHVHARVRGKGNSGKR